MGTKLSNINLYNPYGAEYVLEKGFCSKNIVEGWDTILNDGEGYDFLGMLKQAKKLSKELGTTAVYTNYFDDSELVFEIYINGSRKAYYQTDGGMSVKKGIPTMVKALLLDNASAKVFRMLMGTDMDAAESIGRISALSGLPLYLDGFMYNEQNGNVSIPDKDALLKELSKAKKAEKPDKTIKKTPEVLQEIKGIRCGGRYYNCFTTIEPEEDGSVDYGHGHVYQLIQGPEPRFEKCHEYRYDLVKLSGARHARGIRCVPKRDNRAEDICIYDYVETQYTKWCDNVEKYKNEMFPSKDTLAPLVNEILTYADLPRRLTPKGYAEFWRDRTKYYSTDLTGEVVAEDQVEYHPDYEDFSKENVLYVEFGSRLYPTDNYLIRLGGEIDSRTARHAIRVDFFDYDGNLKNTIRIPKTVSIDFNSMFGEYTFIEEKNVIIANGYCIDLDKKEYRPIGNLDTKLKRKFSTCIVTKDSTGKDLILIFAEKTIYVLDMDLNILYSVSCGGIIISYWQDGKGNLFLITSKYHWTMPYNYKADSVIKLQKFQLGHAKQPNTVKKKAGKRH
ncbi:hypothetical protein [Butyrivibrio sp. XPD2006]|uniref:hypothetical protein n=1 Tax=Butyrivibrio sp. XPD2006 TaxID=1280668 RepID=UPI0003B2F0DC|nr:hypothetical protein [Butyrivibrio sp. XPD2006]